MTVVSFDTHKAEKTLTGVGLEEKVAEAIVAVAGDVVPENVATKADIGNLKADIGNLKADIGNIRADVGSLKVGIERDIAHLELRLMNRMIVVMCAGIAVLGFIIVVVQFMPGN